MKKILIPTFLLYCINTFIFTQYVFNITLDLGQKIGFSLLISIPLCLLYLYIIMMIPTIIIYIIIHCFCIPGIIIFEKFNYFMLPDPIKKELEISKINRNLIDKLQLVSNDSVIVEEIKKIYWKEIKLSFQMFVNFYASKDELLQIISNKDIQKILDNIPGKKIEKILKKEDKSIEMLIKWINNKLVETDVEDLSFPEEEKHWLEKFEDWCKRKNYYLFDNSSFVKKLKNKRKEYNRSLCRKYIRNEDLVKKLLYLEDKSKKEENKLYENDDFYI